MKLQRARDGVLKPHILQQREDEAKASATRSVPSNQCIALEHDLKASFLGNSDGDVTVIKSIDYNFPNGTQAMPRC